MGDGTARTQRAASPASEAAIGFAFEEAARLGVPLVAHHTWTDLSLYVKFSAAPYGVNWAQVQADQERLLTERLAGWQEKYPQVPVHLAVTAGRASHNLLEAARVAQLVVVGSRGRGGVAGMLPGSTSQALLHHSPCAWLSYGRTPRAEMGQRRPRGAIPGSHTR